MFTLDRLFNQYHYTLYYYDQAGNLVKTVPPEGIDLLDETELADVVAYRNDTLGILTPVYPTHTLKTRYHYNTLNQLIKQESPDGGVTYFWYDRLGRIVASQNDKQFAGDQYSYTLYDGLGRPFEAGQFVNTTTMTAAIGLNPTDLADWYGDATTKTEVISTYYDDVALPLNDPFGADGQQNLRNRISSVTWEEVYDSDSLTYDFATHYSYDIAGNVKVLVQEIGPLREYNREFKRIAYDYDLVSGKVNKVWYQKDSIDQFAHWYLYDDDNKLITVYTSHDGLLWDMDANYLYYDHGPLARVELGQRQVQGLDYAYTVQGWLKGMNGDALDPTKEMGADGKTSGAHQYIARDAAGFSLSYFTGDYKPIGSTNFEGGYSTTAGFGASSPSLYNGNIRRATYALDKLDNKTIGYSYTYDQLNRLISQRAWTNFNTGSYAWPGSGSAITKWREDVTYDGNGNILTYFRNGNTSNMDSLTYKYYTGNNQLKRVDDAVTSGTYSVDIDDQSGANYEYDALGNLVKDVAEEIDTILWTLTGKVDSISRTGASTKDELSFLYDPMGNRVGKIVYEDDGDILKTWYIRDAQGNIMSTYTEKEDSLWWTEVDLYGSSRLGVIYPDSLVYPYTYTMPGDTFSFFNIAGNRRYEITNHLGNVLATITDRRIPQEVGTPDGIAEYYLSDIASVQDYYPFGMVTPGRSYSAGSGYRFGFNGMNKESEMFAYATFHRFYDPRLGRWFSIEPKSYLFPFESPYTFALNMPILGSDPDGDICVPCIIIVIGFLTAPSVAVAPTGDPADAERIQDAYDNQGTWLLNSVMAGGFASGALGRKFITELGKQYTLLTASNTIVEGWSAWKEDRKVDLINNVILQSFNGLDFFDAYISKFEKYKAAVLVLSASVDITQEQATIIGWNKPLADFTVDAAIGLLADIKDGDLVVPGKYSETVKAVYNTLYDVIETVWADEFKKQLGEVEFNKLIEQIQMQQIINNYKEDDAVVPMDNLNEQSVPDLENCILCDFK